MFDSLSKRRLGGDSRVHDTTSTGGPRLLGRTALGTRGRYRRWMVRAQAARVYKASLASSESLPLWPFGLDQV